MTVLELTRVDRITKTYALATLFPTLTGPFTTAGIALLPRRVNPVGGTVFTPLTISGGNVTVTYAGPDASSAGAVVVTAPSDAHIEVTTTDGQVATAKAETLLLSGGGSITPLPTTYVTSVVGQSGVVSGSQIAADPALKTGYVALPPGGTDGQVPARAGASTTWATLFKQLIGAPSVQLGANWSSLANTAAQVIGGTTAAAGGLIIPLPIISDRRCLVKVKIQMYSTFGAGNTNVYGALGANASGLGNFNAANVYTGGASSQSIWSNTAWLTNQDLSVQQYVSMTSQNDASTVVSFSANGFRTSLLVEVYG